MRVGRNWWTCLDGRRNHVRDVAGEAVISPEESRTYAVRGVIATPFRRYRSIVASLQSSGGMDGRSSFVAGVLLMSTKSMMRYTKTITVLDPESFGGHVDTQSATLGTNRTAHPLPAASRTIVGLNIHTSVLQHALNTVF